LAHIEFTLAGTRSLDCRRRRHSRQRTQRFERAL